MHAISLHSLAYRRFARNVPFLCYCSCGEVNARSLQDNSKIRAFLLLLMSGGQELVTSLTHISWGRVFHLVRYSYFPETGLRL